MDKKIIMLGLVVGSTVGGYLPAIFGASVFSLVSILCGALGGFLGIWMMFKILN
ncbi:MAG: hypothetical protein WCX88_02810 [Patescibacteria group bacterium]